MMSLKSCLLFAFCIFAAQTAHLPSDIVKCKVSDANCLSKSTRKYFELARNNKKFFGLPSLEPLHIKKLFIEGNGGSVDITQEYDDMDVIGITNPTDVTDFKMDLDKCQITFDENYDRIEMIGTHHLRGKLLVFQLKGFGRSNITLLSVHAHHSIACKKVKKDDDGNTYLMIESYAATIRPKKLMFDFENLIDGNAVLSAEVQRVANENSAEIYDEIKEDYDRSFSEVFRQYVQLVFNKIPLENLVI